MVAAGKHPNAAEKKQQAAIWYISAKYRDEPARVGVQPEADDESVGYKTVKLRVCDTTHAQVFNTSDTPRILVQRMPLSTCPGWPTRLGIRASIHERPDRVRLSRAGGVRFIMNAVE